MSECMMFPNDWAKFLEDYSFQDDEEIYTNGSSLIQTFRVEQMMEHYLWKAVSDNNVGSKWIPVTERLPEDKDLYLCLVKSYAFPGRKYYAILRYDKHDFLENGIYTDDVTHWMPLPEQPKEAL